MYVVYATYFGAYELFCYVVPNSFWCLVPRILVPQNFESFGTLVSLEDLKILFGLVVPMGCKMAVVTYYQVVEFNDVVDKGTLIGLQ